jgi:nitric oxide reductase activation protein
LYERKQRAEIGDRAISVALDLSGSMSEIEAKMALAALEIAASIIGDQFTACGYKSFKPSDSNYNVITTPLITGPDEDFEKSHLNAVWSGGKTPMASGIVEASKLLQECTKSEDVLIVITDGKPNLTTNGHSGQKKATEEARQRVRELKRGGVKVIGLGIGSINEPIIDEIFEGDFVTAKMDDFAEKLVEVYYNQMDVI